VTDIRGEQCERDAEQVSSTGPNIWPALKGTRHGSGLVVILT
jgi:hypothetical protein